MLIINRAPEGAAEGFNAPSRSMALALATEKLTTLAVMGALGLLAGGAYAVEEHGLPNFGTESAQANNRKHENQPRTHRARRDCTTFRIAPKDIYAGSGCGKEGATAEIVGDGHLEKGWSYSAIVTGGVKKCFFVRQGILPQPSKSDPNLVATCAGYYSTLIQQKGAYLKDFNCDFLPSGLQACRSGTPYTPIVSTCLKNVVFRNYATAEPSPWNADGKAPAGFSNEVNNSKGRRAVSYRVKIKDKPRNGHNPGAAVIRGIKKEHGWGLMYPNCPDSRKLRGGIPSITAK